MAIETKQMTTETKPAASDRLTILLPPEEKARLRELANRLKSDISSVVRDCLKVADGAWDPAVRRLVKDWAAMLGVDESLFVQVLIISWFARQAAREMAGQNVDVLPEFQFTPDGPLVGLELFKSLQATYAMEYQVTKKQVTNGDDKDRRLGQEARTKGIVPDDLRISDSMLGLLVRLRNEGRLSEFGLRDQLAGMARVQKEEKKLKLAEEGQ